MTGWGTVTVTALGALLVTGPGKEVAHFPQYGMSGKFLALVFLIWP